MKAGGHPNAGHLFKFILDHHKLPEVKKMMKIAAIHIHRLRGDGLRKFQEEW